MGHPTSGSGKGGAPSGGGGYVEEREFWVCLKNFGCTTL